MHPTHLRYTKEHEWIQVEGGRATVGITEFAQHELGDIVYVELPEKGKKFRAGDVLGTIESVKAVSELYRAGRRRGGVEPGAFRRAPEGQRGSARAGWICRVSLSDPAEVASLADAAAYEAFIGK
jgi:glycine cleavage system H protein